MGRKAANSFFYSNYDYSYKGRSRHICLIFLFIFSDWCELVTYWFCAIVQLSDYSSFEGALYCKPHYDQLFKMTGSLNKSFEGRGKQFDMLSHLEVKVKYSIIFLFCFLGAPRFAKPERHTDREVSRHLITIHWYSIIVNLLIFCTLSCMGSNSGFYHAESNK